MPGTDVPEDRMTLRVGVEVRSSDDEKVGRVEEIIANAADNVAPNEIDEIRIIAERLQLTRQQFIAAKLKIPAAERGGLYHLTAGGQTSWFGFAGAIIAQAPIKPRMTPITTADYPLPAKRPAYSVMSSARLERVFGIALPDWRASLDLCLQDRSR